VVVSGLGLTVGSLGGRLDCGVRLGFGCWLGSAGVWVGLDAGLGWTLVCDLAWAGGCVRSWAGLG
jgi:hypothetical protein